MVVYHHGGGHAIEGAEMDLQAMQARVDREERPEAGQVPEMWQPVLGPPAPRHRRSILIEVLTLLETARVQAAVDDDGDAAARLEAMCAFVAGELREYGGWYVDPEAVTAA